MNRRCLRAQPSSHSRTRKVHLGPFANLPYLQEPGLPFPLFESKAIIQHLGRTHGLYGDSLAEKARIDEVVFHAEDIRSANAR